MSNSLLRGTVEELHAALYNKDSAEASLLVNDLESVFAGRLTASQIGLWASLLFKGSNCLLEFIRKAAYYNEFSKCLSGCLAFVQNALPAFAQFLHHYVQDIVGTCSSIFQSVKVSANKEKCLGIIITLVEMRESCGVKFDVCIVRKLCSEEIAKTKSGTSSSVKGCCFHLLGTIARYYPEAIVDYSERLFGVYLRELKREFERTSDQKLIEGCLKGLCCLMVHFPKTIKSDAEICRNIFKYTLISIQPKMELARYAVPTAGLQMITSHSSQFGRLLVEQHKLLYGALQKWFYHQNNYVKHEAHAAISSFLMQIVVCLKDEASEVEANNLFTYFMSKFQEILETRAPSSKELSLVIQGYGLFAELCGKYKSYDYLKKMLSVMMDRSMRIYFGSGRNLSDGGVNQLHQLPSFLFSLGNIIKEVISESEKADVKNTTAELALILTESFQRSLCQLCVYMIKEYDQLNKKFSSSCCLSLLDIMTAFSTCPDFQKGFISEIVYQGLIRCCSKEISDYQQRNSGYAVLTASDMPHIADDSRTSANQDYLGLWIGLVCPTEKFPSMFGSVINLKRKSTRKVLFNELLTSLISIIKKLDLSSKKVQDKSDLNENDPGEQIENCSDFQLFTKLCSLFKKLLPSVLIPESARGITRDIFQIRACEIIKELIKASNLFPIVPGFYDLLSTVMKVCIDYQYFSKTSEEDSMEWSESDGYFGNLLERTGCLLLLKKFVTETVLYMTQWQGDVLNSSLFFILSLPIEVAAGIFDSLVQPLQMAFRLSLGYNLLAEAGIDALERWRAARDSMFLQPLIKVLPDIKPFLHVKSKKDCQETGNRILKKKKRGVSQDDFKIEDTRLQKVHDRVVRFLGSIGGLAYHCFDQDVEDKDGLVAVDTQATVSYSVPFRELKLDLQLESFIFCVAELAEKSAMRQTKVTACELLHSLTVYIIGKSAHQDETIQLQHPLTGIYECIFPLALKLACDVELVTRQLFEPLVMQMIHWFTNNKKYESPDTVTLLDSILDGLVSETSGNLRDFCSRCVVEFLVWSSKQDGGSGNMVRRNAKSLFKRLYSLALHPSTSKRLGSAMAFNKIYKVFREQEAVVDEFTFELLVTYINSLFMAQEDKDVVGTKDACLEVLRHLQRIIIYKKDLFNQESKIRRLPPGFRRVKPMLHLVVDWLFLQCGRPHAECRHICMELFYAFVPLLPENQNPAQWLKNFVETNGLEKLIACFEGGLSSESGIATYSQISLLLKENKLMSALHWFDLFLASLDCYSWVLQQKLLTISKLFKGDGSNLFRCIDYFLHDIARFEMEVVLGESDVYTLNERQAYVEKRCTVVVRIFQFTVLMLQQHQRQCLKIYSSSIWEPESLLGVVTTCLMDPNALGFNVDSDIRISEMLPSLVADIIAGMFRTFTSELKQKFVIHLRNELLKMGILLEQLQFLSHLSTEKFFRQVAAYQMLAKQCILSEVLPDMDEVVSKELVMHVFNSLAKKTELNLRVLIHPTKQSVQLGNKLLELSIDIGVPEEFMVKMIMDPTILCDDAEEHIGTNHGQFFFSTYKVLICKELCCKASVYVPILMKQDSDLAAARIFNDLLEFLFTERWLRKQFSGSVCCSIMKEWNTFLLRLWKSPLSSDETKSIVITIFCKVISLDTKICTDTQHPEYEVAFEYFREILTSVSLSLNLKTQALTLIGLFCTSKVQQRQNDLKSCLYSLCSLHFPSQSIEFTPGTNLFEDYVATVKALLFGLEMTGSTILLEILISVFCKEEEHLLKDDFEKVLENCLMNVPDANQQSVLGVPYKMFSDVNSPHSISVKCRIMNGVLLPLLSRSTMNACREFFSANIGEIMHCVLEDHKSYSIDAWRDQLALKICNYKLSEMMFDLLPSDEFKIESSPLVQSFSSSSIAAGSTKFLKAFVGRVVRDKNEDLTREHTLVEERRLFHCAVYNAAIAAVTCTQTEVKWFDAFLFCDNPKKKEFLFDNLISKNKFYSFPIVTDEPMQRKKIFSVRRDNRDDARARNPDYESVAYVSSLTGSSLSEDADRFDNNSSLVVQRDSQMKFPISELSENLKVTGRVVTELESDDMNDHECMSKIISLLSHMKINSIGFLESDGNEIEAGSNPSPPALLKWLNALIQKLNSPVHINVKIFIVKLIINCETIFQPFAEYLLGPVMKVILSYMKGTSETGDFCSGIDQFVVDAMVVLLSWSPIAIPKNDTEDKILVRALCEALMGSVKDVVSEVFRRKLDLIKTAFECWSKRIEDLNTDIVFNYCSSTDLKSLDNFHGLQLFAAMLSNGFPPYTASLHVDREKFFQRIFSNLLSSRKPIIDITSEIIGMSLKHLSKDQNGTEGEIHDIAKNLLTKLANSNKVGVSSIGIFITSLHKISRHHPPAATTFLKLILFNLPKLPGPEIKSCCIDILGLCVDKMEDLVAELKAKDFISMLIHRDDGLQHSCLKLCVALVQKTATWQDPEAGAIDAIKMHQECVDFILPHLEGVLKLHPSSRCSLELYDLVMKIYDIQKRFPQEHQSAETLRKVKLILLHGLIDQDQMLKTMVANFWYEDRGHLQPRLPVDPTKKLIEMMSELYQPEVDEAGFLSSCCAMLMQAASRSPDFERPVFEHPLSDCVFQELNFEKTWRRAGSGSLIEETMLSTIISPSYSDISSALSGQERQIGPNMLQATQRDIQFSSTLADADQERSTYNWMTGESLDTFSTLSTDAESRNFQQRGVVGYFYGGNKKIRRAKHLVGQGFRKQMIAGADVKDDRALDLKRLRSRIRKDSQASSYKFARVAARRRETIKRSFQWERTKREHSIQIYRKYRVGELPDIQIPHRGLITSFTALAQHDSVFLQQFMSATISAIMKEHMELDSNAKYIEDLSASFMHILTSSQQYDSTFIGCMLRVILQNSASFNIPPFTISQAAMKSAQRDLGIRVIEEQLILQSANLEPTSKRRRIVSMLPISTESETLAWVSLARLYRTDFDTLRGIFSATPIARSLFSEVVSFETHGEYNQALKVYQKALLEEQDPEPSDLEKDLWEDSLLNCLEKLGKWKEVNRFCDTQTDNGFANGWTEAHFQERFLSTSLHAKMLLLLQGDSSVFGDVTSFVEHTTQHAEDRDAKIESPYSDIAAMLYIYQGDYNSASYYLHKSLETFSVDWEGKAHRNADETGSLNKLFHLSNMKDFLELVQRSTNGNDLTIDSINNVLEFWTSCVPHGIHDPISTWQDMVTYRSFFIDELLKKIKSQSTLEGREAEVLSFQNDLAKWKITMILQAADQACKQKHFAMARQFLNNQAENVLQAMASQEHSIESMQLALSTAGYYLNFSHHLVTSRKNVNDLTKASKAIAESHTLLLNLVEGEQLEAMQMYQPRLYTLLGQAYDLALDLTEMQSDNKIITQNLQKLISSSQSNLKPDELACLLRKQGLDCFRDGIDQKFSDVKNSTELYIKYAKFCDRVLRSNDSPTTGDSAALANSEILACNVIKYVLRTMKHQNCQAAKEASLKYPRLLQLVANYPGCVKACFLQEASEVPTWVFLCWIGQMVALLDKPEADSVQEIVSRLAAIYPQAVIYSVKTSFPDFSFVRDEFGKKNKTFANKLHSDLDAHLPVVKTFIKNLTLLTSPARVFKEWYENACHILRSRKSGKNAIIIKNYQMMYGDIFVSSQSKFNPDEEDDLYDSPLSSAVVGTYRIKFADKFRAKVDEAFGGSTGGSGLMDEKKFFHIAKNIYQGMDDYCKKQRPQTLKEYSKWFFDFQSLNLDKEELEIPGQYKGESKPMPQYHTKIIGFEDKVQVMSSLQQPKKITIKASDCKHYQYLVKGNEDLRQDQRIQQLFEAMNVALQQDPMCSKRKLCIKTYQVVPVTSRLGLIEWIDKTRTLHDIVLDEAKRINRSECWDKAQTAHVNWLNKYSPNEPKFPAIKYGNMVKNANYTQALSIFQEVTSYIPQELLRNFYLRLSSSPEAFLALRREFATSYGTLCAAHWILGIGDRHTSNCMISLKSGTVIGIDFGHAFGTATEVLGVPELVPFRLSPQLCYLMAPHPAKAGLLRQSMLFCLCALRSKRETILAMLDVFLKEPSVDWLKHANKIVRVHGSGSSCFDSSRKLPAADSSASSRSTVGNPQWYPLIKINMVDRKLSGYHPSDITQDELQQNYQISKTSATCYKAVAAGVKGKCFRSSFDVKNLSVDDQVDCLIDQATDPNILSRSYHGWRFWI